MADNPESKVYRLHDGSPGTYKQALEQTIMFNERTLAELQAKIVAQKAELDRVVKEQKI